MEQNNSDEIDLGIVFSKIKDIANRFLISVYNGIQFLIKHWWKLLIVAVVGAVVGFLLEMKNEPSKETVLIVQNNFKSSDYVYNAINQLNQKLKEKDTLFLDNAGFRTDTIVIKEIEVKPIVNMMDLLNKSKDTYRSLETYLEEANYKDEVLSSELFLSEYKYHKILINTSSKATNDIIENVISYLNSNEVFNDIKDIVKKETIVRIDHYKETITKIDNILESQSKSNSEEHKSSQLVVSNGADYTDFYELINSKNNAIAQVISLETELTKYDDVVSLMNKPVLINTKEVFGNKKIMYAFVFVFLYMFFFFMKGIYNKLKTISENAANNG